MKVHNSHEPKGAHEVDGPENARPENGNKP